MKYRPIIGVLGFILSPDQKQVLLVHRTARKDDDQYGKYNGLGGKLESDEDLATGICREIHEEAGIVVEELELRGTVNWNGFGPKLEDWLGFIYLITKFSGSVNAQSPEGPLEWVDIDKVKDLPTLAGDEHFLGMVFDGNPKLFNAYMKLKDQELLEWRCER